MKINPQYKDLIEQTSQQVISVDLPYSKSLEFGFLNYYENETKPKQLKEMNNEN